MKLTLTRSAIHDTLQRLARVIPARTTIPMLGHILMRAERGVLSLAATNLDMDARATVPADVEEDGVFAVPGQALASIVGALGPDARISFESKDTILALKSGRFRPNLKTLPADDFSNWAVECEWKTTFDIDAKELLRLLVTTAPFASTNETRWNIASVFLEIGMSGIIATATDGHRMANVKSESKIDVNDLAVLLPIPAVIELKSLLDKIGGQLGVSMGENGGSFRFASGFTFTCKFLDATFPDYRRLIEPASRNSSVAIVDSAALAGMADRLLAAAPDKDAAGIRLEIENGMIRASIGDIDYPYAIDEIPCEYEDQKLIVCFSLSYMRELIASLDADTIAIKLSAANEPSFWVAVGDRDDAGRQFILMPRVGV